VAPVRISTETAAPIGCFDRAAASPMSIAYPTRVFEQIEALSVDRYASESLVETTGDVGDPF